MDVPAIALFAFVAAITPGPNNVMLSASGLNFGFRRTIPHMLGITLGFMSLVAVTASGLGALFQRAPWMSTTLRIVASVYLLYLAYRIATAAGTDAGMVGRPFTFWEAAAFQYANPKAWVMTITAGSSFLPPDRPLPASVAVLAVTFGVVMIPSVATWAGGGTVMGRVLTDQRARRTVNIVLALLLVWTVWLINR